MSDGNSLVTNELNEHKADLDGWIAAVSQMEVPDSAKGVNTRFVRDCHTLKSDIDAQVKPSSEDLIDFVDRRNSLEIQYTDIIQGQQ